MVRVEQFIGDDGRNRFGRWFDELDFAAAAKVMTAVERLAAGHRSCVAPVGEGVAEYKVDYGPGYRVYFGQDGDAIIILLGGGTKKRQSEDIAAVKESWREYKQRRKLTLAPAKKATGGGKPEKEQR